MRSQRKSNAQNYLAKKSKYPLSEYLRGYVRFFSSFWGVLWCAKAVFPHAVMEAFDAISPARWLPSNRGWSSARTLTCTQSGQNTGCGSEIISVREVALKQYFSFLLWQITRNSFDFPFLWTVIYYLLESRTENIFTTFPNTAVVVWVYIDFSYWKNGFQS